jgi:hypothetical protein
MELFHDFFATSGKEGMAFQKLFHRFSPVNAQCRLEYFFKAKK